MVKAGIIDPVKVVQAALSNAASIAGLMLTTEALVTNFDKRTITRKPSSAASGNAFKQRLTAAIGSLVFGLVARLHRIT